MMGEEKLTFIQTFGIIPDVSGPVIQRESLLISRKENVRVQ
jgi:hypothetical protein